MFNRQEQTKLRVPYHSMFLSASYCQGQNFKVSETVEDLPTLRKYNLYGKTDI